jgi:hypothetical protein
MHPMKPSYVKVKPRNGFTIAVHFAILCSLALGVVNKVANARYQKPCTGIRVDFKNVLAQAKRTEQKNPQFGKAETQRIKVLLETAAANPQCFFNSLSDGEALLLVKALCRLEAYFGDGSNSKKICLWESFLKRFPRSLHLDEARWLRAKAAATPYEYEGYADAALQQIKSIEEFIKENPANSYLPDAEMELAQAFRIAYETFRYGNGLTSAPRNNQQTIGRNYRDRAKLLLKRLCSQAPDRARQNACRALGDLEAGRCVYIGPGSPNADFPDHWLAPKSK